VEWEEMIFLRNFSQMFVRFFSAFFVSFASRIFILVGSSCFFFRQVSSREDFADKRVAERDLDFGWLLQQRLD
jgi:hypothetical protein